MFCWKNEFWVFIKLWIIFCLIFAGISFLTGNFDKPVKPMLIDINGCMAACQKQGTVMSAFLEKDGTCLCLPPIKEIVEDKPNSLSLQKQA